MLYVGGNIGGGWGKRDVDFVLDPFSAGVFNTPPQGDSFDTSGVIGGLQLGYNWQFNRNWLVGLEADFDWSGIKGSGSSAAVLAHGGQTDPFSATADEHIKWFGTVRARLGYLPTDNLLAYVTGGFAYGKVEHSGGMINNSANTITLISGPFAVTCFAAAACYTGSSSDVATGWTVGGGLEYAIWSRWTLRAEYLYVSLKSNSITETAVVVPPGAASSSINTNFNRTNINVARVGVNYRF
jgi:outer membrane immunogenic protein